MSFDCSRITFDHAKDYFGVVMEQGRVQLDSDWNEWLAEFSRRIQAGTLDLLGRAAYPMTTPHAFEINAQSDSTGNHLTIGAGRMYVDGLLAENHGILPPVFTVVGADGLPNPDSYGVKITSESAPGQFTLTLYQVAASVSTQVSSPLSGLTLSTVQVAVSTSPLQSYIQIQNVAGVGEPAALSVNALYMLAPGDSGFEVTIPAESNLQWDPALAELSGAPVIPGVRRVPIDYTQQPYLPGATLPANSNGPFLAYLDVWQRTVSYIEDPHLIEKAVGVDTTGRLQAVWQVKLLPLVGLSNVGCATNIPDWNNLIAPSAAWLTNGVVQSTPSGPCCLTPNTGYTGMENQLYRVEIHRAGQPLPSTVSAPVATVPPGTATFKWSRDNSSVATAVSAIAPVTNSLGNQASQLTVQSLGRDHVLGFSPGDWIEIADDYLELNPTPSGPTGELHQIDTIDASARTISLVDTVSASFPLTGGLTDPRRHTRIKRWDQSGKVYLSDGTTMYFDLEGSGGDIPVPAAGTTLLLENGITVSFGLNTVNGSFHTGDFWRFAARTADGSVESLTQIPPSGIHHHYARLSIVTFNPATSSDCRAPWPSPGDGACGCCCTCTVGDGAESVGKYTSIQAAIDSLPATGGEVCILPGRYYENVFIEDRQDIIVHGCGSRTRVASPSLQSGSSTNSPASPAGASSGPGAQFSAVISIASSRHIELRSFAVEAAQGDVGILIDGTGALLSTPSGNPGGSGPTVLRKLFVTSQTLLAKRGLGVVDTTIEDMVITASTLPAILAKSALLLHIDSNRIAMEDVFSMWPAVYVSGTEIHIDDNWVGIQSATNLLEWVPARVSGDMISAAGPIIGSSAPKAQASTSAQELIVGRVAKHPGGVLIAGASQDVSIVGNMIEGGSRNGITLGSFVILDAKGVETNQTIGLHLTKEDAYSTTPTLYTPGETPGRPGTTVVVGGKLVHIQIDRNRIANMGLCGIGPAGFFNLRETLEVITVEDLSIKSNTITNTLQRTTAPLGKDSSVFGYGSICLPDVKNLIIRDNFISNFGTKPGSNVCGIFILHGQMVEISRNHVLEDRDWNEAPTESEAETNPLHGGIRALLVTSPTFSTTSSRTLWSSGGAILGPIYEPGLPALRIEHNVVRVPLGESLAALGFGPFAIVDNHFGSGGTIVGTGSPFAQTVAILNMGASLESAAAANAPSAIYTNAKIQYSPLESRDVPHPTSGTVLFTNNICQLESRAFRQHSFASVAVVSLDHLVFANNHCWLDAPRKNVSLDAFLLAGSLQVTGNRFQEAPTSVLVSGWTVGALNVTSQNISTYCLLASGDMLINNNNLALIQGVDNQACREFAQL